MKPLRFGGVCYCSITYPLLTNLAMQIPTTEAENSSQNFPVFVLLLARHGQSVCGVWVEIYSGASENGSPILGKEMSEETHYLSPLFFCQMLSSVDMVLGVRQLPCDHEGRCH